MPADAPPRRILLVAGEPSGDQAAAHVVRALKRQRPQWSCLAVGGDKLKTAGAEVILPYEEVAVMGFTKVLRRLPSIRRHFRQLSAMLRRGEVDLLLPVDFPGFNLRLCRIARGCGVPVLYFIAPQLWAWGKGRLDKLRRDVNRLAFILPFEEEWFRREGVAGRFVGHPIMEKEPPVPNPAPGASLALMPGSRAQEVESLLPLMLDAARRLRASRADLRCALLESPGLPATFYDALLAGNDLPLSRHREESFPFLSAQRGALVASGTATLETAVAGVPMAVVYRTSALNYWLAMRLISVDRVSLVNLVAGENLVPELIQKDADPAAMAAVMDGLLREGPERQRQLAGFTKVRNDLGGPGCGERVAAMAIELLEES